MEKFKHYLAHSISLFFSVSTLLCCAVPVLLVALGFGTAVSALISAFPFLITLTQYKEFLFSLALLSIFTNAYLIYFRTLEPCPVNVRQTINKNTPCTIAHTWNKRIFLISVLLFTLGVFTAYLAQPLLKIIGW